MLGGVLAASTDTTSRHIPGSLFRAHHHRKSKVNGMVGSCYLLQGTIGTEGAS